MNTCVFQILSSHTCSSSSYLIQSIVPNTVKSHMKQIILHRRAVPKKVSLHLPHPQLQFEVLLFTNRYQYLFKPRHILLRNNHRKHLPIQYFKKRRHIVVRYNNRHTLIEDGLHNPRAINFMSSWTYAVLAALHVLNVIHLALDSAGHWASDFHVRVLVLPML